MFLPGSYNLHKEADVHQPSASIFQQRPHEFRPWPMVERHSPIAYSNMGNFWTIVKPGAAGQTHSERSKPDTTHPSAPLVLRLSPLLKAPSAWLRNSLTLRHARHALKARTAPSAYKRGPERLPQCSLPDTFCWAYSHSLRTDAKCVCPVPIPTHPCIQAVRRYILTYTAYSLKE